MLYFCVCPGNCVEAFVKFGESLEVMRRVHSSVHPTIAETLKDQANVHAMLGNYREALPIFTESLAMYRDIYGSEHSAIAEILLTVAGFQNTFMTDVQQYIESCNTPRWTALDVQSFRYSKAQRVAAAQFLLDFTVERGLLDVQLIHTHPEYEQHTGALGEGQLGTLFSELMQLTAPRAPPSLSSHSK